MVWGEESLRRLQNHQVLEKEIITTVAKYIFLDAGQSTKLSFLLLQPVSMKDLDVKGTLKNVLPGYNHQVSAV